MDKSLIIAWAAGLFEGEGTFQITGGKSKGICISSTDKDVLDKLQLNFKGNIYNITKRKAHWKDSWIWVITGQTAIDFYTLIKPYLLSRRKERGEFWLEKLSTKRDLSNIITLREEGKTHKQIGEIMNIERSSITHYLNKRKIK